jgi:NifU-like protein involved in Fe-S cluster formation
MEMLSNVIVKTNNEACGDKMSILMDVDSMKW